ncbi:hypothetical protein ACFX2I_024047 [Malus domestica]
MGLILITNHFLHFLPPRMVIKKVIAKTQHEGDGAIARRAIGSRELKNLDPFLMLDHFSVSPSAGFLDHPHRLSHTCYREALLLKTPRVTRMLKLANPMPL